MSNSNIDIKNFKNSDSYKESKNLIQVLHRRSYEKYVATILNYLNGTMASSQTSPTWIGQLTEIYPEYLATIKGQKEPISFKDYYLNLEIEVGKKSERVIKTGREIIDDVVERDLKLRDEMVKILTRENFKDTLKDFIEELIFVKTVEGLQVEPFVAREGIKIWNNNEFDESKLRKSTPEEESKNIDFIYDDNWIQIKPKSYKHRNKAIQKTNLDKVIVFYYEIKKNDINIEIGE